MRIGTSRCPRRRSRPAKSALDRLLSDQRPARRCRYHCERTDCRRRGRGRSLYPTSRGHRSAVQALPLAAQTTIQTARPKAPAAPEGIGTPPATPAAASPATPAAASPATIAPSTPTPSAPAPSARITEAETEEGITEAEAKPEAAVAEAKSESEAKATVPKAAIAKAAVPEPAVAAVPVAAVASHAIHAVVGIAVPEPVNTAQHPATKAIPAIPAIPAAIPAIPTIIAIPTIAVIDRLGIVWIAVASVVWVVQVAVVATDIAVIGVPIESTRIIVVDAWVPVVGGIWTSEPAVDLAVHLGRDLGVGLVGQVVGGLGGFVNLSRGEESSAILESAIPVTFLEGPAFGLADPVGRNPCPAALHLGPETLLPDHAILVGVV